MQVSKVVNGANMEENSKCIICRKGVAKSETHQHPPTNRPIGMQERTLSSWKNDCAVTLCEVLLGTTAKSFYQYFRTGEFCSSCLAAVRDINFTWKQVKSLERRMNQLSAVIQRNLKTNYGYVEQKTKAEVVEERISAALNPNDTEDGVSFLDSYSYDEITEILHSATSIHSCTATFFPFGVKNEPPSFSGDYDSDSGMLPLKVKLELDQEEINESEKGGDDYEDVTRSRSQKMQKIKRKRVNRRRRLIKTDISHNEHVSAEESNDDAYNALNDSEGSESSSDDSWSTNLDDHVGKQKSQGSSAKSKRKMGRQNRDPRGQLPEGVKLECPTCHKMISRTCFVSHQRIHTGEKPFVCPECGRAFNSDAQFWRHAQKMHAKLNPNGKKIKNPSIAVKAANEIASRSRTYHCDLCSWKFTWKFRYLRHLKDTHLNKDIKDGDSFNFHYCDEDGCPLSFTSLTSLKTHISETHSPVDKKIPIFECNICQRIFSQQSNLESHAKSHEDCNFGCDYCCLTFPSRNEMKEHLPRHQIVFQLSMYCHLCEECGERFSDVDQLRKHIANLHVNTTIKIRRKNVSDPKRKEGKNDQKFFCNICKKAIYRGTPERHLYSHTHPNGFQCPLCPVVLKTPKILKTHQRRAHNNKSQSRAAVPSTSENKTMCHVCQQEVYTNSLEIHLQSHFHPNGFQCLKCPAIELSPELLQIHERISHPPLVEQELKKEKSTERTGRKITCQVCQKIVWKTRLENHMYSHTHPGGFQCPHPDCKVKKRTPNLLKYHESLAHNKKKQTAEEAQGNFLCSFEGCGKRFAYQVKLTAHLNVHNNRKPYECPYCSKCFANEGNCHSHVVMVHTKHRSIRCKLCPDDIGFFVKKEFCKHVQRVHPGIPESEYMSILERKKADVPVKVIHNKILQ